MRSRTINRSKVTSFIFIRSILNDVCWTAILHSIYWSVLSPGCGPGPWGSGLSSLLLSLTSLLEQIYSAQQQTVINIFLRNRDTGDGILIKIHVF